MNNSSLAAAAASLTPHDGRLVLVVMALGMLLAGLVVILGRSLVSSGGNGPPVSVIRSWIAVSLVMGLLVLCAGAFLLNDAPTRSTLFGGLISSVGAAVAFYFANAAGNQAQTNILQAAGGGMPPTGFSAASPPAATSGAQYKYTFASDGQPAPVYGVSSGSLPPDLTLGPDGTLQGIAGAAGTYTFSVAATNPAGTLTSDAVTIVVS